MPWTHFIHMVLTEAATFRWLLQIPVGTGETMYWRKSLVGSIKHSNPSHSLVDLTDKFKTNIWSLNRWITYFFKNHLHLLDKRAGTQRFKEKIVLEFLRSFSIFLSFLISEFLWVSDSVGLSYEFLFLSVKSFLCPSCLPWMGDMSTSAALAVLLQGSCHAATQRPLYLACANLLTPSIVLTPVQS